MSDQYYVNSYYSSQTSDEVPARANAVARANAPVRFSATDPSRALATGRSNGTVTSQDVRVFREMDKRQTSGYTTTNTERVVVKGPNCDYVKTTTHKLAYKVKPNSK